MPRLATNSLLVALNSRTDAGSADKWIQLLPIGTFKGRDGRGPYKVSDQNAIINTSRQQAGKTLMPVDYDHATDLAAPRGEPAPAAGWIDALQERADGIWGRVDWTPRAAAQLDQREYRYLSPVITHEGDGTITSILRASLTNTPNFDQLKALAGMETTTMDKLTELRAALGLPADATIDDILAKVTALSAAPAAHAAHDPSKFVPIGDFERTVAELKRVNQGVTLQASTLHVEAQINSGYLPPFLKDWGISLCTVNKPAFDKFMERTAGKVYATIFGETHARRPFNSHSSPGGLSDDEIAIASNLGVAPDAFLKTKTVRGVAQEH